MLKDCECKIRGGAKSYQVDLGIIALVKMLPEIITEPGI